MKRFRTVISLNYDLVLYWAMTYGLDIDDQHAFREELKSVVVPPGAWAVGRSIAAIRRVFGFLESDLAERDAQAKAWLDVAAESAAGPDDREADD